MPQIPQFKKSKKMRILIILLLITFNSFGQTKELDELKKIWIDDMLEFGDIVIKDINWNETFVPYYKNRAANQYGKYNYPVYENRLTQILEKVGVQTGDYYTSEDNKRIARGRYWIEFSNYTYISSINGPLNLTITDSKNNFKTVGTIYATNTNAWKNFDKAYDKYFKKNKIDKRRKLSDMQIVFEEILKRYRR